MVHNYNKTGSPQGNHSPEHVARLSISGKRPFVKVKTIGEIGESSRSGENVKKLKYDNISLEKAIDNVLTLASGIAHSTTSREEENIYNQSIEELFKEKNHFMNAILALLPKFSTEKAQNKKRLFSLYNRASHIPTKEFIANRSDAQEISTIQTLEANRKANNTDIKQSEEESTDLSETQKLLILLQIQDNDYLKGEMQKFDALVQQFFPVDEKEYEKNENKEQYHFPFEYRAIEDDFSRLLDKNILERLVRSANPDIKQMILKEERMVKDENGQNIGFIRHMVDKYPNDSEVENLVAKYVYYNVLDKIFSEYENVHTILNIAEKIVFNSTDEPYPQVDSSDISLLIMLAKRKRLSSDDKEHNQHLGRLLELGNKIYDEYLNKNLLIALAKRKDSPDIEGRAFSTDAVENQQRSDELITTLLDIINDYDHI